MAKAEQNDDMDDGRFAPVDDGIIDGEVIESTERAIQVMSTRASDMDMSLVSVLTRAELDQQITTARAYPRSITRAMNATKEIATLDIPTAQECGYALPRGKDDNGKAKVITGPSVRLAEIVAGQWGNCRAESRTILVDRDEMFVEAEGMFHDLETNYAVRARVRRSIRGKPWQGKPGKLFSDDMINVTSNAAGSIAFRNAVFKGVPKPIWAPAYFATIAAVKGDIKTLNARRIDLITAFRDQLSIKPEQLYKILGVPGEADIGLDELVIAAGFFSGLKNNEITIEDLIRSVGPTAPPTAKGLAGAFGDKPADKPKADPPKGKPPETSSSATSHDPKTGEVMETVGPTSTASAPAADAGQASSGSATKASEASLAQAGSGQAAADDSSTDGDESEDDAYEHVAGTEKTDPRAFMLWAPTVEQLDRKKAFTALTRSAAYKALNEATRDMVAAAVDGDVAAPDEVQEEPKAEPTPAQESTTSARSASEAVGAFWNAIDGVESWLPIKAQVGTLYKSDEFRAMDEAEQRQIRIEIWEHVAALVAAKKDPLDFATDPGAFRLWLETCDDPDGVQGNFNVLMKEPAWAKMKADGQNNLTRVVENRIADLKGGA